jgi:FkbM family methyltransferase
LRRFNGSRLSTLFNVTVPAGATDRGVRIPLLGGIGFDNLQAGETWLDPVLQVLMGRRAGTFVDVGVNVGQTLIRVKRLNPDAPYIGFEPNPVCYSYTQRLIADNGFQHCTLLPVGLSSKAGIASFFIRSDADVGGSTIDGFRSARQYSRIERVAVFPGDDALATLGTPPLSVIKIDVEGAELEVIEGLRGTLATRPFVVCEILPVFTEDGAKGRFRKPRQEALLDCMRQAQYVLYRIMPDASIAPLTGIEIHGDPRLTNYLFAPQEERGFVEEALARP